MAFKKINGLYSFVCFLFIVNAHYSYDQKSFLYYDYILNPIFILCYGKLSESVLQSLRIDCISTAREKVVNHCQDILRDKDHVK